MKELKLGEALTLRALQGQRLADLRTRVLANAVTQEGVEPQENAETLLQEFEHLSREHADLIVRIARTNSGGQDAALQEREHLRRQKNMLDMAARHVQQSQTSSRWTRTELAQEAHLKARELHDKVEALTEEIRQLDADIQLQNWNTNLAE